MIEMCPVCHGRGLMGRGFYPDNKGLDVADWVKCRACGGKGVITEAPTTYPYTPYVPYYPTPWYTTPYGGGIVFMTNTTI